MATCILTFPEDKNLQDEGGTFIRKYRLLSGVVMYTFIPSAREAEAAGLL